MQFAEQIQIQDQADEPTQQPRQREQGCADQECSGFDVFHGLSTDVVVRGSVAVFRHGVAIYAQSRGHGTLGIAPMINRSNECEPKGRYAGEQNAA